MIYETITKHNGRDEASMRIRISSKEYLRRKEERLRNEERVKKQRYEATSRQAGRQKMKKRQDEERWSIIRT